VWVFGFIWSKVFPPTTGVKHCQIKPSPASLGTPPSVYRLYTYATIASNPDIVDKPQSITVSADSGGTTVLQQTLYQYFGVTGNLQQKSDLICPKHLCDEFLHL